MVDDVENKVVVVDAVVALNDEALDGKEVARLSLKWTRSSTTHSREEPLGR